MTTAGILTKLSAGDYDKIFTHLYTESSVERQKERYTAALKSFDKIFGAEREVRIFSAPGRTEIGGNHTDHQHGRVLAAAVNMDIICIVAKNEDNIIRVKSEGYNQDNVDLSQLDIIEKENNRAISLIRGMAARCKEKGFIIGGFDAYTTSDVLKGSGLSSSAAFEVAMGTIISHLFNDGGINAVEIAKYAQYAENVYFGKPSGLMDQMASSVGGFITIDFKDTENPVIEPVEFDFTNSGHTLCIVDTGGNHADLTNEYASIPPEMKSVANMFGAEFLREVDSSSFYERIAEVREKCGDRPVLRAMHFFGDNSRVVHQAQALRDGDFDKFKQLIIESGRSSGAMLQNVFASSEPQEQGLSVALSVSEMLLAPKGAWRVHGGGFAGTIQAFVPNEMLVIYTAYMEKIFGEGSCHKLSIRPVGGTEIL